MNTPTAVMKTHMRTYREYLQRMVGWTPDQCEQLASEYDAQMQTPEGFTAIESHLASVGPLAAAQLQRMNTRAAA